MLAPMRVGVAQIEPRLGERERNLAVVLARLEEAPAGGAELVVFRECALSGYMNPGEYELRLFDDRRPDLYGVPVQTPVATT
jgi:predicted amidohydrolase